jgi:hypothetical protein
MGAANDTFRLELPGGWEDRTVHYFSGPKENGIQHSLNITVDRELYTVDIREYAWDRIDQLVDTVPALTILKSGEKDLFPDTPAWEVLYKWVPAEGQVVFQKVVYAILDGKAYTFSARFSKKTLKTMGREVDGIIATFVPLPQERPEE